LPAVDLRRKDAPCGGNWAKDQHLARGKIATSVALRVLFFYAGASYGLFGLFFANFALHRTWVDLLACLS